MDGTRLRRARQHRAWAAHPLVLLCLVAPLVFGVSAAPAAKPRPLPTGFEGGPAIQTATVAVAASSASGPTTPILDDFNRPDEDPLSQGGLWALHDPRGPGFLDTLEVISQQAGIDNTTMNISYRQQVHPGDTEVFGTIAAIPPVGKSMTLHVGIREIGGFSWDGYYLSYGNLAGADSIRLSRVMNNESSVHFGEAFTDVFAGDKLLLRKVGSQLEGWHYHAGSWTLVVTGQDDVLVGGRIGAGMASTAARWDDVGGGAFVPPTPPPPEQSIGTCGIGIHAYSRSACRGQGVNTLTGAFTTQVVDLALPGIGVPFAFTRTYMSGTGWTHTYETALADASPPPLTRAGAQATVGGGDIVLRGDEGQEILYTLQQGGTFSGAAGAHSTLSGDAASGFTVLRRDQVAYRYDAQGRLTSMKDRNNHGLTFAYDSQTQKLATVTDSAGRQIAVTFTGDLLTRVTLPDGRYVEYAYANGQLTSVRDARGHTTAYGYDPGGRLETIVDQRGKTIVRNVYDPISGRVTEQFDALQHRTTFAGDPQTGGPSTMTDARSNAWTDVYENGVVVERRNPLGHATRFAYDADLNVTAVTDPRGHTTTMEYDGAGNLEKRTAPAPLSYVEEWTYTPRNDPDTYKDGRGNVTDNGYDGAGNLTSITQPDADGPGPLGQPTWIYGRDPGGTGLLTSVTDPRGKQTTYSYTNGDLTEIRTHMGHRTTMCYDGSGRMVGRIDPRGTQSCSLPNDHRWSYTHNANDQLESQTDPLGHVTDLDYDPAGNLTSSTDAKLHETTYSYDDASRLERVTAPDPDGGGPLQAPVTQYGYDAVGNLETVTDAEGRVTDHDYDPANRLITKSAPGSRVWTYGYDASGNLNLLVDANGNATATPGDGQTVYGYDALNRLDIVNYSDATPDVDFDYDATGNRTKMVDGSGTETYAYDPLNRLTSVTRGADVFSYVYDLLNPAQATYPGGFSTSYGYDDDERLQSATSSGQTTSYGYDAAANLRTTTLPSANGYVETRSYDNAGRLIDVENKRGASTLSRFAITPDPVGNPLSIVRTGALNQIESYSYDDLDQLTGVCFQAGICPGAADPFIRWSYDRVGNRLTEARPAGTTTYTYNAADELTGRSGLGGSVTYGYDANGNQIQAGPRTFAYDLANRMKSTTSGSSAVAYAYDGLGKRVEAIGEGTPAAPTLRTPCSTAIGTSGTATVSKPVGTLPGDLIVVGLAFEKGSDVAITAPSGWTLIRRTNQSSNVGYATYRKLAGASEPASYAFALTNSPKWSIGACAIAGADATTPIDVHAGASGSSGNPSAPSLTTAGPSRLVLAFYSNKKPATYTNYTAPAVERWDAPNNPGGLPSNAMASYTQSQAGATGAKSATASEQAEWVAQQIAISPGASVTRFLWDANQGLPQLALERDANNNLVRRYSYGARRISQTAGSDTSYFLYDGLGSVSNLTSSTGATQWTWSYEPFGSIRTETQGSGAPANFLKFAGEYLDPSGLYHLRARQYDPVTGRFLSRDPIPGAGSAYAYAGNNPTAFVDPSGLLFGPFDEAWRRVDSRARAFVQGVGGAIGRAADGHAALDVAGLAPIAGEPADLINCVWYGAEGEYANAALSCGATLPWLGIAAVAAKTGRKAAKGLPDEALVVRGGENTAERFVGGSGVSLDDAGRLHGVSVNSAPGRSLRELTQGIPNKQVGVTTVGDVRKAGGYVRPDPLPDNPFHCLMGGCTPQQFSNLFTPTIKNPWTG